MCSRPVACCHAVCRTDGAVYDKIWTNEGSMDAWAKHSNTVIMIIDEKSTGNFCRTAAVPSDSADVKERHYAFLWMSANHLRPLSWLPSRDIDIGNVDHWRLSEQQYNSPEWAHLAALFADSLQARIGKQLQCRMQRESLY